MRDKMVEKATWENTEYAYNSTSMTKDLQEVLLNYNIGKKPLSKILGWGETTIIRYAEGDIPSREYSEKIRLVKEQPGYFYELLMNNQDKLTSVAFKKSSRAVIDIMMKSKQKMIAQHIINRAEGEITLSRIQCILYYAQVLSLVFLGKELFDEVSWENYSNLPYRSLLDYMRTTGIRVIHMKLVCLNKQEKEIVDCAYDTLAWYGVKSILGMHVLELMEYWDGKGRDNIVSTQELKKHYTTILGRYNIAKASEFMEYTQKRMKEVYIKRDMILELMKE